MDNASMNDVLARTLRLLLLKHCGIHFTPENGQIHCLTHVVNLIVQKILHELFEADDPTLHDYYELFNKHLPIHYDLDGDEKNQQLHAKGKEEQAKVRKTQIDDSTDDDGDDEIEEEDDIDVLLEGANLEEDVAGASTVKKREWKTLQQLGSMLEVSCLYFCPLLTFICTMHELKTRIENDELLPNLCNAAAAGLEKLEEYYESAKQSQYTVLATILHPSLHLEWFCNLGSNFVLHACVLFKHVYARYAEDAVSLAPKPAPIVIKASNSFLDAVCTIKPPEAASGGVAPTAASPLVPEHSKGEKYFVFEGGHGEYGALLDWWKISVLYLL
uniref:Branched-chain-amino-acid aminotransferase TOXF (EC) n=1 Tax=Ganoderma boninense TaxID=34458 RepID=A0A5K1K663_9APHY|nr:Putative branched-chain-amino-acid aminotransferase TOXF (EC [Ganoderma boninense]